MASLTNQYAGNQQITINTTFSISDELFKIVLNKPTCFYNMFWQ